MCDTDIANLSGLRELIRERLEQFCGYDTSSMRTEQAREVMRSTEYVLRAGLACVLTRFRRANASMQELRR